MKKMICMFFVVAVLCSMVGCRPIHHPENATGKVIYDCNGIYFEEELTPEEVSAVLGILNGKVAASVLEGSPSCGFDRDVAIIIDGTRYALACDKCGTLKVWGTMRYIHISDGERAVLEEIFTSRGGKFPCI